MWVPCCADSVFPANAVKGGTDLDGSDIFVGRAYHEGDMIPAKVIPARNVAYVAYGGREVAKHTYEVLVQKQLLWQFASNGQVPDGAVAAGTTADGDQLFVGRVFHEGTQTIGKVSIRYFLGILGIIKIFKERIYISPILMEKS